MEKIVFFIIVLYSMYIFMKKRHYFDFLSLMFFSTLFYFLPMIFGFVTIKEKELVKYIKIDNRTYYIAIVLFLFILLVTLLYDKFLKYKFMEKNTDILLDKSFVKFCLIFFCIISIIFYVIQGYSMVGKVRDISKMIGIYKVWSNMILILGVVSIISNCKLGIVLSMCGAIFDLYLGDRTITVIFIISIVTYTLIRNCNKSLFSYKKIIIIALIIISPLFIYKKFIGPIQRGDFGELMRRATTIETYTSSLISIEPFTTQSILNEVVITRYKVEENTLKAIKNLIPFYKKNKYKTFNEQMQKDLFSNIEYGMGSNIWAEIYSNSSIIVTLFACFIYACIGIVATILFESNKRANLRVLILLSFSFFIFYVHRNSIAYQLNLNLRIIYLYIGMVFAYKILKNINYYVNGK